MRITLDEERQARVRDLEDPLLFRVMIHDTRARLAESHDRPAVVHAFTVLTGREDGGNDWAGRVLFMLETCLIAGLTNLLYEVWGKGGGGEGEVMG